MQDSFILEEDFFKIIEIKMSHNLHALTWKVSLLNNTVDQDILKDSA